DPQRRHGRRQRRLPRRRPQGRGGRRARRLRRRRHRQHAVVARDHHHDRRPASGVAAPVTDTAPGVRGGFPEIKPAEQTPPGLGRFVAAMRRLQDLAVSTNGSMWSTAAEHVEKACALMYGHFTRSHVGGNNAVHGGMIPLFYDWLFGMVVSTAGVPPTRTAYLHVDYRSITPVEEPLTAEGRISDVDGRKFFVTASMTAADGTLLSEANGL